MDTKKTAAADKPGDSVRAVARALDILMAFTANELELTASELLNRVDLSRPTLYRLLYTLEDSGFLVSSGDPQRFRLGPSVAHLAHVWTSTLDLADIAAPILRDVWKHTGETVALFVRQGDYRMCIAELPSAHPLSFKRGVGYREPLVYGASGHAILAHAEIRPGELSEYMEQAGVDPDAYLAELAAVRRDGYAVSKEEVIQGAVSLAAPFFNKPGEVGGSIVVFGPSARLGEPQIAAYTTLLVEQAAALSRLLYGSKG